MASSSVHGRPAIPGRPTLLSSGPASQTALIQRRLILASASPRRQELLSAAGYAFEVCPATFDESTAPANLLPADLAKHLGFAKAAEVAERFPDAVVLGADTVVAFGDRPLGKPATADEARRMLSLLAGTTHIVITGVAIVWREGGLQQTQVVMSGVHMRRLSELEIEQYVASNLWQGKAGGYGIQDKDPFVTKMSGSQSNIVGLPMEVTGQMLSSIGVFAKS